MGSPTEPGQLSGPPSGPQKHLLDGSFQRGRPMPTGPRARGRALLPAPHTSRERAVGEMRPARPGSLLQGRVVEQLLDQVHVGQQHAAAAVALQAQRIQGVPEGEERAGCGLFVLADGGPCLSCSKPCSAAVGSAPHVGEGHTSLIFQRRRPSPSRLLVCRQRGGLGKGRPGRVAPAWGILGRGPVQAASIHLHSGHFSSLLAQTLRPSIASPLIRHTCTKSLRLPGTPWDPEVQM